MVLFLFVVSPFPGSPYDFISLEWLQKWLDESTPPKPIDNTACLCSHGKLHPDKISLMKRISEYVADFFYRRYGGGPRLNGNILSQSPPGMCFGALFWSQPCFELSVIIITLFQCKASVLPYFQGIFLIPLNSVTISQTHLGRSQDLLWPWALLRGGLFLAELLWRNGSLGLEKIILGRFEGDSRK